MSAAKDYNQLELLLENAPIGIFSIQEDLLILSDYSRYLEEIAGEKDLKDKSFTEVFLSKSELNADERSKVSLAIQYSMGSELMFWEANSENLPKSIVLRVNQNRKSLEILWKPLVDDQKIVQRLLITMRDVTETLKFRQQAIEGQNRLKYLGELITLGPERFKQFEDIFDQHWENIQTDFYELSTRDGEKEPYLRHLFQELHTLKATARMNNMSGMTHTVHEAEEFLGQKSSIKKQDLSVIADHLQAVVCCLDDYQKALKPLLAMKQSLFEKQDSTNENSKKSYSFGSLLDFLKTQNIEDAKAKGRRACFFISEIPEDFELSPALYGALQKAYIHLLSNTMDHGLESEELRLNIGKPQAGIITFFKDAEGRLCYKDDGQGIDIQKVEAKSREKGYQNLNTKELLELLFSPGFSTKKTADYSSGRGIGLDAARAFLEHEKSGLEIVPIRESQGKVEFYFASKLPKNLP